MTDPRRLLENGSMLGSHEDLPGGLGRWLLDAGKDVGPPAGAKAQVWGRLEGLLGPAAAGGASGSGTPDPFTGSSSSPAAGVGGHASTAASATSVHAPATQIVARKTTVSLLTKLGLAGMVLGGGLFVASVATQDEPKLSADLAHDVIPATSSALGFAPDDHAGELDAASTESGAADAPKRVQAKAPASSVKPATSTPEQDPKSSLMRESDGVKRARALLGSGDATGALAELAALDREVGPGVLGPERHVLAIEAMAASGRGDVAAKQAAAFIDAHPNSPYAKRLAPIAGR